MKHIMVVTVVIFLSPHRLVKELEAIKKALGDIEVVLCQELTKLNEKISKEKISQLIDYFGKRKPRGEFTLVFGLVEADV